MWCHNKHHKIECNDGIQTNHFDTTDKKKSRLKMDPSWNYQPYSESFQRSLLAFQVKAKFLVRLDKNSFSSSLHSHLAIQILALPTVLPSQPLSTTGFSHQCFCHTVPTPRVPSHWMPLAWRKSSDSKWYLGMSRVHGFSMERTPKQVSERMFSSMPLAGGLPLCPPGLLKSSSWLPHRAILFYSNTSIESLDTMCWRINFLHSV